MIEQRNPLTLEDAAAMLSFVPSDDRQTWLTIGMALHAEYGDAGYSLWDEWSQTADNYSEKDARSVWRSFRGGGVTIASLIHTAREHGYAPHSAPQAPLPKQRPAPKQSSDTRAYALRLWLAANRDDAAIDSHPYAVKKGISWAAGAGRGTASGRVIGKDADVLIIPIREHGTGKVQGVQVINPDGQKQTFGSMQNGYLLLGNDLNKCIPWAVVEGWADAVSFAFHWHQGNAVAIAAFGLSRLDSVAQDVVTQYAPRELLIVEDAK